MKDTSVEELFRRLPDVTARDELVAAFQPLAMHLARRYANRGEEFSDLRQVANVGLLKAIDRFDAVQGRFSSFAVPTISGELKRHFRDNVWGIGVPRHLTDLTVASRRSHQELTQRLGRPPTTTEVAAHAGVSEQIVLELRSVGNAYRPDSLDAPHGSGDRVLIEVLGEFDESVEMFDDIDAVKAIIESMSRRDQHILFLRFHYEMTQSLIAEHVGVSQMEVSRILRRSIALIRLRLGDIGHEVEPAAGAKRPVAV
jgi:RNA polymerase sigma-B factor